MSDICSFLQQIASSIREAEDASLKFMENQFYEEGSALEKMAVYPQALSKIPDLASHYERMDSLVAYTSEEFQKTDQAIKSQIESNKEGRMATGWVD